MKNLQILLSDTHFGIKNNSSVWLESQLGFFYNEVLKFIKKFKNEYEITVVHCGDVFDSRTTVNVKTFDLVQSLINEIASNVKEVVILAGNHDYYLQDNCESNISSLAMLKHADNVRILHYIYNWYNIDDNLFLHPRGGCARPGAPPKPGTTIWVN